MHLQDLFAELRPNMTRYSSIEEVNAALLDLEEHERNVSTEKATSDKYSDTEKPPRHTPSRVISANGTEENGKVYEDIGDSDTDSRSGTTEQEGHDEEDLDEENHDEDDDDDDEGGGVPASDEDDEVCVRQKQTEVDPEELANFDQELRAFVQESMEQHKQELRGRTTLNMVIPMNVFEGSSKDHQGRMGGGESGDEALEDDCGEGKEVQVKVLVKRGNKQQMKQMYIPKDSTLIQSTKQKEAAELEEKQDIKRLVLEYNDREEDSNGLGTQTLNQNWIPGGSSRFNSRSSTWEGSGKRSGSRHGYHHYYHSGGGGSYHGRRK